MVLSRGTVLGWLSAALLAALPWAAWWRPGAAPLLAAAAVVLAPPWHLRPEADPWAGLLETVSGLAALAAVTAWPAAALWAGLAAAVTGLCLAAPGRRMRPEPAGFLAVLGWGAGLTLAPDQVARPAAWLGAAVLLAGARRAGLGWASGRLRRTSPVLGPPTREVRGELALDGLVGASVSGLPATRPVSLKLEPGQSAAVLLDHVAAAEPLVEAVRGRRAPAAGTVTVDGEAPAPGERLMAVVAPGEPLLPGGLDDNLAALRDEPAPESQAVAAREACSLDEVDAALERAGGEGLGALHRLLVQAARVMVSHYRIVLVVDPSPWVNTVLGEIWRRAVVRASVGRTALWITSDRELARRADRVLVLRAGVLVEEEETSQ